MIKRTCGLARLAVSFLYHALAAPLLAQAPKQDKPEMAGMSVQRMQRINQLVEQKMKDGKLVNAITLVARKGKVVHFAVQGQSDVGNNKPLKAYALFRNYSISASDQLVLSTGAVWLRRRFSLIPKNSSSLF